MVKLAGFAVAAVFFGTAFTASAAQQAPVDSLVSACMSEALRGGAKAWRLEPSLRPMIEGQRARMTSICERLSGATAEAAAELVSECVSVAASGPRHIQRGRNMDREHIARQEDLCRALAARAK